MYTLNRSQTTQQFENFETPDARMTFKHRRLSARKLVIEGTHFTLNQIKIL